MDASVEARLWRKDQDSLSLRVGKDKPPISMDLLSSGANLSLLERGPTAQLSPTRDIGVALFGTFGPLEAHAMLSNGAADGTTTDPNSDDAFELSARLGVHLGPSFVGLSGSVGEAHGATVSTYRTPGRRVLRALPTGDSPALGDGLRWRAGAHARLATGPLLVWGEALMSRHEVARDDASIDLGSAGAWEAGLSWLVGGDNAWDQAHKPGSLELALRIGGLDENPFDTREVLGEGDLGVDPGRGFLTGAFAMSWQVDSHISAVLGYEVTDADGMNLEHLVGLRLQGHILEKL
jgi:hypothetical protein